MYDNDNGYIHELAKSNNFIYGSQMVDWFPIEVPNIYEIRGIRGLELDTILLPLDLPVMSDKEFITLFNFFSNPVNNPQQIISNKLPSYVIINGLVVHFISRNL